MRRAKHSMSADERRAFQEIFRALGLGLTQDEAELEIRAQRAAFMHRLREGIVQLQEEAHRAERHPLGRTSLPDNSLLKQERR